MGLDDHPAALFAVFFVVNLALKSPGLGESIWLDEAVTIFLAQQPLDIANAAANDATPPLYYVLARACVWLFGVSAAAVRGLSVIASSATAGLIFLFGRRFFSSSTGVIAALLFTASNVHLHYAQEARCYALLGLLVVVSFYLFLALFERPTMGLALGLAGTNAALVYTHYLVAFGLLAQVVTASVFAGSRGHAFRYWLVAQVGTVAALAPWIFFVVLHWPPITPVWLSAPTPAALVSLLQLYTGNTVSVWIWAVVLLGLLVRVLWLAATGRRGVTRIGLTAIALWAVFPVGLSYLLSAAVPMFLHRYVLYSSLGLFLLFGYLLSEVDLLRAAKVGLIVFAVGSCVLELQNDPIPRLDWKSATAVARGEVGEEGAIVLSPWYEWYPFSYYFDPGAFRDYSHTRARLEAGRVYLPQSVGPLRPADVPEADRVVALTNPDVTVDIDLFRNHGFYMEKQDNFRGVTLTVFVRGKSPKHGNSR